MLARTVAGVLSNRLDTEVKIKTFYIKPDLSIYAEEVQINDRMHNPMFYLGEFNARLSLHDFSNEFRIGSVDVNDFLVNIVEYEGEDGTNFADVLTFPEKDGKESKRIKTIIVDELNLTEGHVVVWNQNRDKPEKKTMDYFHIDVDSINVSIRNISFDGEEIKGYIDNLYAIEKSGFKVDKFTSKSPFVLSSKGLDFKNMRVESHATSLDLDLQFVYNDYRSYIKFVDSIMIVANIRPSQLTLSDLKYFAPEMEMMNDTLQIGGSIYGCVRDFTASKFNFSFKDSTSFVGTIKMKGLPDFFETHIAGKVDKMYFTYQDISEFAIPTQSGKIPLPETLSSLKYALLSGEFYGFHNNFNTSFNLFTNLGNINMNGALNNDTRIVALPYYFAKIHANNMNIGDILGVEDDMVISFSTDMEGEGLTKKDADLDITFDVDKLKIKGNEFKDFIVEGCLENQRFLATTNMKSNIIGLDLNGMMDISAEIPSFDIDINVENADLYRLHLLDNDKKMLLSTNVKANFKGVDLDKMYGRVVFDNTSYSDSRGNYFMDSLNVTISENHFDSKDISVKCDFFDADVNGIVNFKGMANSFKNYVMNNFHVRKWSKKGVRLNDNMQDFYVSMTLKNTETLSRLLMPKLKVGNGTSLTATFVSDNYQLHTTIESDEVRYNNFIFSDIYLKNKTEDSKSTVNVQVKEFVIKEESISNPVRVSLENVGILVDAHNDSLLLDVSWDDDILEDRNKGLIEASYVLSDGSGGRLHVSADDVLVNDSLWSLSPTCYIDFKKDKIQINEFDVYSTNQSLNVKGYYPRTSADTLYLNFDKLDISNFDLLTANYGIDVNGVIDGTLQIAGVFDKFTMLSNLDITNIGLNNHVIGNAFVDANWNAPDTSIYIDTEVVRLGGGDKVLSLVGNYYTARKNNLDFDLNLNGIDLGFVNAFTKGVLSRISGELNGDFDITGSLKKPIIDGEADLYDAACNIDYLNTYYAVNKTGYGNENLKPYMKFSENRIDLQDIILVDTLDNIAVVEGAVTHDYLSNFIFDVDVSMDNFLGINMLSDDNSPFYVTAIANGNVGINGPLDDVVMNIDAQTMPGTLIGIRLTSTTSINDNFIIFVKDGIDSDTVATIVDNDEKKQKFTLNLNADVTQDAKVNLHLPMNMGNINANGSGNIRLGYDYSHDNLSLFGDYIIDGGTFNFSFQNLVKRSFDIKKGGSISWTGDAYDADINVAGSYRTKSSISSLGIEMDSTSLVNNVNVDCIVYLKENLNNPAITFGLALPNATDDIRNTVFSVIDTTNQVVMSQQIISLLVLGSFSYSNSSLYSIGASNYYNVLTSSLSSWLSQISKDFDVGVRYTPEDNITAEELEVALSTQLFDDRLTIEGNLGMYTGSRNEVVTGANSIVGDVDITLKLTNRLSLKAYNHSNINSNYYSYSYEAYSDYTQGIGISYSQSFDSIKEIFARNKNKNKNKGKNKNKKEKNKKESDQ